MRRTNATRTTRATTDGPTDRPRVGARDRLPSVVRSVVRSVGAPWVVVWCVCVCVMAFMVIHYEVFVARRGAPVGRPTALNSRVSTQRVWYRLFLSFGRAGVLSVCPRHGME